MSRKDWPVVKVEIVYPDGERVSFCGVLTKPRDRARAALRDRLLLTVQEGAGFNPIGMKSLPLSIVPVAPITMERA